MAATITRGSTINTGTTIDGDGGSASNTNINDWLESATIAGITDADFAAANVDGAVGTPSLRRLVTDGTSTTAGRALGAADTRLAKLDSSGNATANKINTSGTAVSIGTTAPTAGQVLTATSATAAAWSTPGAGVEITGTGTLASSGTAVTGTNTIFTTQLKVGDIIVADSEQRRIVGITNATSLTVDSAWTAPLSSDAFTFIQSTNPRPWNVASAKSTNFTPSAADSGALYRVDAASGNIAVTMPAANAIVSGNGYSFLKTSDDANTVTLTCAGADTFDDGKTTKVINTRGGTLTVASDGVSVWDVVAQKWQQGQVIQSARVDSATRATISASYDPTGVSSPASTDGTEALTATSALTLTPRSAYSKLRIRGMIYGSLDNGSRYLTAAVFSGTTLLGAAVKQWGDGGDRLMNCLPFEFYYTSGQVTEITFTLRLAPSANNFYLNGINGNNAALNSNLKSWIEVEEVAI